MLELSIYLDVVGWLEFAFLDVCLPPLAFAAAVDFCRVKPAAIVPSLSLSPHRNTNNLFAFATEADRQTDRPHAGRSLMLLQLSVGFGGRAGGWSATRHGCFPRVGSLAAPSSDIIHFNLKTFLGICNLRQKAHICTFEGGILRSRHRSMFLAVAPQEARVSESHHRSREGKEGEISPEKISWAKKGGGEKESAANLRAITASRKEEEQRRRMEEAEGGDSMAFFRNEKCPKNWNENWNEIIF